MKIKNIIWMLAISALIIACNNDSDDASVNSNADTAQNGEVDAMGNPLDSMADGDSTAMTDEANTGVMPAIKSSYFGKDDKGYEVTYNFLGNGRFEKYAYKGNDEIMSEGTYKQGSGSIILESNMGNVEFKKTSANEYQVTQNGKDLYKVKEIQ